MAIKPNIKSSDTIISNTNLQHLLDDIKKNQHTYSNTYILSIVRQFRSMFGESKYALNALEEIVGIEYFV